MKLPVLLALVLCSALLALLASPMMLVQAASDPRECEVCVEMLGLLEKSVTNRADMGDVEAKLEKLCSDKTLNEARKKVCYYVEPIKRDVSQLMKNGLPNDRICHRLKSKSAEICTVRNKIVIEKGATDYNTLKVKDLKKILADRGVTCNGCTEKSEFVAKCVETEALEGKRDGL